MSSESRLVQSDDAELYRPPAPRDVTKAAAPTWHDDLQVRSACFEETLNAADRAAIVPVLVAAGLLASFSASPSWIYAAGLLALVTVAALAVGIGSRLDAFRNASPSRVTIGLRIAVTLAGAMGAAWGAMPVLLFPQADADHRMIVLAAVAIMMTEVYRLGPIQRAALFYMIPISVGSAVGFAMNGSQTSLGLAAVVPVFGWLLLSHCRRINAAHTRYAIDRVSIAEQNEAIHELLLNFDENTCDWLWRTDAAGRFSHVADGASAMSKLPAGDLEGIQFEAIFARLGASPAKAGPRAVLSAFAARKPFRDQLVEIKGDEKPGWWRLSGKPSFDAEGRFQGYRGVGTDMTGTRNSEMQIAHLANFDALTGFANRSNFQIYAARQCAAAAKDGHCRALLSLDIDGFKTVNDRLGCDGGDELLRLVAGRLTAAAPGHTFIARLGGDEFALWLEQTTPMKAEAAASALIEALSVPFNIRDLQIDIGASVGIAFAPKHAIDPDDLLTKADLALYRAKAEHKGQVCVFAPAFETSLIDRRKLEGDLKLALARGEFALHYQPLLDVANGRIVGFEALIRWHSPDRGFVSPAEFIPAAESMGLIAPIGRWVLSEACRTAATWPHDIHVAVNVSPPHVRSPEFLQDITMALKHSGLHPSRLEIEVTEGVFLDKSVAALEVLGTLRTRGVKIALDDFGTGYSSLNYLIDFPVDKIKIDRSFVNNFVESHANQAIVDAILGLARKLSIRVTAEGVETREQALALKRRRCDEIQGYLLSRPRPAADVPDMLASVPALFREAVPTYMDSPLAMALTVKKAVA